MAIITIRNLDETLKKELRIKAAQQGISMEEQVRRILRHALLPASTQKSLGSRIHQRFVKAKVFELELPERSTARPAPDFSDVS